MLGKTQFNPERGMDLEWLVTNGIGGYASGNILGGNGRKYHGLLVASLHPPVDRHLLWSAVIEELEIDGIRHPFSTLMGREGIYSHGYRHLQSFRHEPCPAWTYWIDGVRVEKKVMMARGENATVVAYEVKETGGRAVKLHLTPLVNFRDFHHTTEKGALDFTAEEGEVVTVKAAGLHFYLKGPGRYEPLGCWYENMYYPMEEERGQHPWDNHFMPGRFVVDGEGVHVLAVSATLAGLEVDPAALADDVASRREAIRRRAPAADPYLEELVLAAADFVVEREGGQTSILAGYPWFNDWGRDAMIALPGLTLVPGLYDEAREILRTFARHRQRGLLPNLFGDRGVSHYNTVDASLWFVHAVQKTLEYTGDLGFAEEMAPVIDDLLGWYRRGTDFSIAMEEDGLVRAGEPGVQLTWMDAKVGDWVVTPRHGKPVEINALWYNALRFREELRERLGREEKDDTHRLVRESFQRVFWNEEKSCLYDVVGPEGPDPAIRPNQIFAVSLPHPVLEGEKARRVTERVFRDLYAGYGLRSLAPSDPRYVGTYQGDQLSRDGSYHQGTVWGWLLGPFVTALRQTGYGKGLRRQLLVDFRPHLWEGGIGQMSEIFDGDPPNRPRGCIAQAWTVAETLRSYWEDVLRG